MTPACMTTEELLLWDEANRITSKTAETPCRDCPVAFAVEMRAVGRCNGVPLEGRWGRPPLNEQARLQAQWRRASAAYRARQKGDSPLPATASTMAA